MAKTLPRSQAPRRGAAAALLPALLVLGSCAATSRSFVEERPGYAVTSGRITHVEGMSSDQLTTLADGVGVEVDSAQCRVTIEFPDGRTDTLELHPPAFLVFGADRDYVLQPARSSMRQDTAMPSRE